MFTLDALPEGLIACLRAAEGIKIFEGERAVFDISDSPQAIALFKAYLSDAGVADPLVTPHFGIPPAQFVPLAAQAEVWSLLVTFEPLIAANFLPGAIPFPLVPVPVGLPGGVFYHHSNIALQAVQDEIVSLSRFAAGCPALAAVPSGNVICELVIQYAKINILMRLRKY